MSRPATEKQIAYLRALFTEAQQHCAATPDPITEAVVEKHQATIIAILRGDDVDGYAVSAAISDLRADSDRRKAAALPVGVQRLSPQRVITGTRYAGTCISCSDDVAAGSGYAVLLGRWRVLCDRCAAETAEQEAERKAAERAARAEAQAQAAAEAQAAYEARQAATEAERNLRREIAAFAADVFARAEALGVTRADVRLALRSATGHNDLDFFRVSALGRDNVAQAQRWIGGSGAVPMRLEQQHAALERIVLTDDLGAAMTAFAHEEGTCSVCAKSLTDYLSRFLGLGPICRSRIGVVVTDEIVAAAQAMAAAKGWPLGEEDAEAA